MRADKDELDALCDNTYVPDAENESIHDNDNNNDSQSATGSSSCKSLDSDGAFDAYDDDFGGQFDIRNLEGIDSWEISDSALRSAIKWYIWKVEGRISDTAFNRRPCDSDTPQMSVHIVKKLLKRLTSLVPSRIPCCINVCVAVRPGEDDLVDCPYCNEPIYESFYSRAGPVRRARKEAFYFSPIPRLMLDYALPHSSQEMQEYVTYASSSVKNSAGKDLLIDFWTSDHFQNLRSQDYFKDHREICLSYTTDGCSITRQRSHSVWPGCLTIHNLPPELRFRRMMIVLVIPGPSEPKDMGSFHSYLVDDLQRLSLGLTAYDGWKRQWFTMKAHLCFLSGDFPAMAKMTGMRGSNAKAPCRFCSILGEYSHNSRHMYYPLDERQMTAIPALAIEDREKEICLRTNLRQEILLVIGSSNNDSGKDYGIAGISWFFDIDTLDFPLSFGLDVMHLFSNVAKHMWAIWTGAVLLPDYDDDSDSESYLLSSAHQEAIGADMRNSARTIPVSVSRTPRDISKHKGSFKATEWFEFITVYSIPLLRDRLPSYALDSWRDFVRGVKLALRVELNSSDVHHIEQHFRSFVCQTETIYYQQLSSRLPICTSQLHSLLHVASGIRALGPTFLYWQFGIERYVGNLEGWATSKSQQDVSLFNTIETNEHLRYVKAIYHLDSSCAVPVPPNSLVLRDEYGILGTFLGPVLAAKFMPWELRMITRYYQALGTTSTDIDPMYNHWSRLSREITVGTMNSFQITATRYHRSQANERSRSCCAFSVETDHSLQKEYGEVLSFIEHEHQGQTHHLAFVQNFTVAEDDGFFQLIRRSPATRCILIGVGSIDEPIGLINTTAKSSQYPDTWLATGHQSLRVS